ncbi:MAG TPA: cyclic pyranopterin monophosphate synthase MoaC [Candidatus Saccharimonadia bacterium]|nr:cyclic pyranopterin monophosphate synthase MoaC [Candidatus Saccharimonadia bacterium]
MATRPKKLTHVDAANRPRMVDVSAKPPTRRTAIAEAIVEFPEAAAKLLSSGGLRTNKGPVVETAIIAGVMAAKRTHELIPFCHPLALEDCQVRIEMRDARQLRIECEVSVTGRTGVEMEALTGASVAALTVYDMTKALSHGIVIRSTRLIEKTGGRKDYRASR